MFFAPDSKTFATGSINEAIEYFALFGSIQLGRQFQDPNYRPLNVACVFSPPADVSPSMFTALQKQSRRLTLIATEKWV